MSHMRQALQTINNGCERPFDERGSPLLTDQKWTPKTIGWTQHQFLLKFWTFKINADVHSLDADVHFSINMKYKMQCILIL